MENTGILPSIAAVSVMCAILSDEELLVVTQTDSGRNRIHFDRHAPEYREQFETITKDMHAGCPMAWTDTHGGHWVAAGADEVFHLARSEDISNDNDVQASAADTGASRFPPGNCRTVHAAACSRWTRRSIATIARP